MIRDIFDLIDEYFWYLLIFPAAAIVPLAVIAARQRAVAGPLHPPFARRDILFSENYVTGFGHAADRVGSARCKNGLSVKVLEDAVLIEPIALFKWITPVGTNGLEHYILKSSITRAEPTFSIWGHRVLLEFRDAGGLRRRLTIVLRKPKEFMKALNAPPRSLPSRT